MTDQRTPTHAMIFWKRSFDGVGFSKRTEAPVHPDQVAALLEAEETAPGHVLGAMVRYYDERGEVRVEHR